MKIGFDSVSCSDILYIEFNDSAEDKLLLGNFMSRIKAAPKDSLDKIVKINCEVVPTED